MPLYVLLGKDKEGAGELRQANRAAHLEHWGKLNEAGRLKFAGPLLDEASGAMCGSLLIFEADDLAAADALRQADPYLAAGVFGETHLHPVKHVLP